MAVRIAGSLACAAWCAADRAAQVSRTQPSTAFSIDLCLLACHPLVQDCEPGEDGLCAEGVLVGAGCPPDEARCCTPFCQYPGGACPNPDQQCLQYYDTMQFPPGDPWLDVGVCGIPG